MCLRVTSFLMCLLITICAGYQLRAADQAGEDQKIEALIQGIEKLADVKFIRNNSEYDAATAARFLRGKWQARKGDVKTADDFIEKVASKSSTTGQAYKIRFADGTEQSSADYLRAELKNLER